MVSSIMKRAVALQQAQQKNAAPAPPPVPVPAPPVLLAPVPTEKSEPERSALLKGVNVERWLSAQVSEHRKDKSTSPTTKARYGQVALTLDVTRPKPWEPVDIEQSAKTKTPSTPTALRCAGQLLERAAASLRVYKNTKDASAKSPLMRRCFRRLLTWHATPPTLDRGCRALCLCRSAWTTRRQAASSRSPRPGQDLMTS